jgi:hypothetical protein
VFRTVVRKPALETLRHNAAMPNRRPRLELIAPAASPEEAAAVVAALERFMRATAPVPAAPAQGPDPWQATAILEGVERENTGELADPWLGSR